MQRFWWPGYEVQLLGELQRQQNRAQFCDTLLQTEGISVPTHSCVLAALSPYLSQRLSTSPSPPYGQKRQLRLQAVTAQTLLKLVGLLYSGELEVKGDGEQNDVLAATHQFGIQDLVVGYKDGGMRRVGTPDTGQRIGSCREAISTEKCKSLKVQDAQVQAEITGRRENEKTSCVSVGTQTVKVKVVSVGSSTLPSDHSIPPRSSIVNVSVPPLSQSVTLDKHRSLTPRPPILSDGESTVGQPTGMSALSSDALPASLQDDSSTLRSDEGNVSQLASVSGDAICLSPKESRGQEDGKADGERIDGGNVEHPRQDSRDEIHGEEKKTLSHAKAAMKSFVKMNEMEQISFKLKLKRRTKGEVWEVVGIQDTNEMLSVLTSNKQGYFCHTTPQTDLKDVPTASSSAQSSQKPETQNLHPVLPDSPKSPKQPSSGSGSHPLTSSGVAVNQSVEPQGSVEESDEQIERLLEDIMMGLNILPDLDSERKKSHPMSSAEASSFCHLPVSENGVGQNHVHAVGGPAVCVFFQDLGTRSSSPSSDSGIPCFCGAQNKTGCRSLSAVQPEGLMQQSLPQFSSSVRSSGQKDEMSFQDTSRSEPALYSGSSMSESVMQKRDYSALEESSSQEDGINFLPLQHASSLLYMEDLRLPQRLSPLETRTNLPADPENDLHQQPVLRRRPWLTETPESLQFPLNAMTRNKNAPSRKRDKSVSEEQLVTLLNERTQRQKKPDEGIPCFCGAQNKTGCRSLSAVQPEGLMQQSLPQFSSSVRSSGQKDEMSFQDTSRSEPALYSGSSMSESVMQKRDYSALEESSSQEDGINFLPLQSEHASSLLYMEDLRLPQRLSLLENRTNLPADPENDLHQQPVLRRRPWLTETPESLQFPLNAMTRNKNAPSRKRDKSCDSEENNGNSRGDACSVNDVEERGTYYAEDVNSDPKVMKERSKFIRETTRDSAAPKRSFQKCEELLQDGGGSFLASKKSKVTVGTEDFIVETVSSNDVSVKEVETVSSNKPCPVSEKPEERPNVTQTVSEKVKGPENLHTERTRIRTRGFLKRSQENRSNSVPADVHVSAPAVRRDSAAKKEIVSPLQRKRGRPCKIKLEESSSVDVHAIAESKRQETSKQQGYKDLPKSEEDEMERRRCIKKKRRKPSETEAVPPKENVVAACDERAEADRNAKHHGMTKQSWMTTLKEFQKLIRQKHPNSRKSKDSRPVSESARGAGSERMVKTDLADESADDPVKESAQTDDRGFLHVDENHNQLFNASPAHCNQSHGDARSSSKKERASSRGDRPRSSDVSEEQLVTLLNERTQRQKKPDEDFCVSGGPAGRPSSTIGGGEALSGSQTPQDKTTALSHTSHPQTPETSAPLASGADGIETMLSQEEDVEIDVVLYSPEKKPPIREYEGGFTDTAGTPDEEEEDDDVIDIDVTGD